MVLVNGTRVLVDNKLKGTIVGGAYVHALAQGTHRLEAQATFHYVVQLDQGGWLGDEKHSTNAGRAYISTILVHPAKLAEV